MQIESRKVTVLGAKQTGIQSALFLKKHGADVLVSELRQGREIREAKKKLDAFDIRSEFGSHSWEEIRDSDLVIISPGIPPSAEISQKLLRSGIPIWSEIELACQFSPCEIVAVTGSNGKTTVTTLIRDVLRASGKRAISCGNIGNPFIGEIEQLDPGAIAVLEVSSFQLTYIDQFKPRVGVLLNLSVNHLDWHKSFDEYADAKFRLFENQTADDLAVINSQDTEIQKRVSDISSKLVYFGGDGESNPNFSAVKQVAAYYGIAPAVTQSVLDQFSGLEHRFEHVTTFLGVHYVNDSKSTTIASLGWALDRVEPGCILIAGGRHKGGDFKVLTDLVKKKVGFLITLVESKKKMDAAFGGHVSTYSTETLDEALRVARSVSKSGQTVLFSPACASFDMFRDYQDRGAQFKKIVLSWQDQLVSVPER